jgi:long-chain acyl-CoA synthetase
MTLADLLHRAAVADPNRPALAVGAHGHSTFGQMAARVATIAGTLRNRFGLEPGARVALALINGPAFLDILCACWHGGLVPVPMNAKLHPREFAYILGHCGVRLCCASPKLATAIATQSTDIPDCRLLAIAGLGEPAADERELLAGEPISMAGGQIDDAAWLFYTSGTTGRPKGAVLSHRNLLAMARAYTTDVDSIAGDDCILHAAPMSHGSGLYAVPHLAAGALQVIPESGGFDPAEVFDLLRTHAGMTFFAAPTMVKRLVEHPACGDADPRNLKTVVYGGGPMYGDDIKRAMARLGNRFAQIYGQGESPMTITAFSKAEHAMTDHPRYEARLASVGRAQSVVEVRIGDADDRTLPVGELGEVLVRGDSVMRGYWHDPEASARTLRGGWLHTGDLGVLYADGYLTLKDRSKDVIISGGANIYPREVEEVLQLHPGVSECAVIGRPHADWGEAVAAFIVARPSGAVTAESLDALCLERLARFKRPRDYRFVESLPKNAYGKILKTELRALAAGEHPCGGASPD